MRLNKDYARRGHFGAGRETSDLRRTVMRRFWPLLGQFAIVGLLIVVGAVVFTGELSEPGRDGLSTMAGSEPATPVEAVAFSPDGRTIACCGWDASVCLWNVSRQPGAEGVAPVYLNHDSPRLALAFSSDGRYLAAAGEGSLAIWSCESGDYTPVVEKAGVTFRCVAFSPDGGTLALGGDDGAIRLWDTSTWRERAILVVHTDIIRCVAFSPDGRRLVSSGQDRRVMLWDAVRGVAIRQLSQPGPNPVQLAAFSPDGNTIAIGELSGVPYDVGLIDPETGAIRAKLVGHASGIRAMAFAPGGRTLATAGDDGCIKLWNFGSGKLHRTISDRVGRVKALAFSPNGTQLVFADLDQNLRVLDLKPNGAPLIGRVLTKNVVRPGSTAFRSIDS
jgi:WD40 repeat protein